MTLFSRRGDSGDDRRGHDESRVGVRLRSAIESRRRLGYWPALAVLGVLGFAALLLPGIRLRPRGKLLPRPDSPRPELVVLSSEDVSFNRVERRNIVALARPGADDNEVRRVLDWALYELLIEFNERQGRRLQVVWVYAVEDLAASPGQWRAMAVWVDPSLPERLRPETARLGPGALKDGDVQYSFENPSRKRSKGG